LGVSLNARKYWKFRTGSPGAAFNIVRRLSRLPPEEKWKVVIGKLLPILMYGSELHTTPLEEGSRLSARMSKWVVMRYQGSSRGKIEELSGIEPLVKITCKKRIRWAACVHARNKPDL